MYVGNEPLCFGADEQQFCVLALKNEAVMLATSNAAVFFFHSARVFLLYVARIRAKINVNSDK